jgi:N-glycosylase/DNA lyase
MEPKYIEVTLIKSTGESNVIFDKVLNSVNTYLIRNKGAVSDFNLIKDVVERNTDAVDEEINTLLPIPLYLGLMGTMLGIVVGLFAMPSISDENFEKAIDILIGGVKIAMIASFTGLLLTVLLSGWKYKGAKTQAESLKNDFFTWIQTHLLPVLSQNTTSSIYSLQANLLKFNDTFSTNVVSFNGVLSKILESFDSQVNLMNELKDVDVAQLAKINVTVLQELRTSTKEFEKFNTYLHQVNSFVDNAQKLNFQIGNQLERTQSIELVAEAIGTNITANREIITILQSELQEVSNRKQFVSDAVIDVDNSITKSLEKLKEHIDAQMESIRNITIKEESFLENLLGNDRGNLNELKKLGKLEKTMSSIEKSTSTQNEKLDKLGNSLIELTEVLKNQKQIDFQLPKNIKNLSLAFFGSGATIGIGYCLWSVYKLLVN